MWDTDQYAQAYIWVSGIGTSSPVYPGTPPGSGYSSGSGTMYGLSAGRSYTATGYVVTAPPGSATVNIGSASFTTPDYTAPTINMFYATSVASNSVTVYASASDSGSGVNGIVFSRAGAPDQVVYGSSGYATFGGLSPNTSYTFGAQASDVAGNWSPTSYTSATTLSARPTNFAWTYSKSSGNDVNVYAFEWNALASKINEFRTYKGLSAYSFTTVSIGTDIAAWIFNQAVAAINAMSPPTSPPSTQGSGSDMYAAYFNGLVNSLNSIT